MSNKVNIIYQKLRDSLNRKGFLNINHIQAEGRKKLTEIGYLFKSPSYQTFRIIYIKNNLIVGEEVITSSIISNRNYFDVKDNRKIKSEKCINIVKEKMQIFKANKYLLVHTSPQEHLKVSKKYLDTTTYFYTYLNGFMGHLIINSKSYIWIDIYKNNIYIKNNKIQKDRNCANYSFSNYKFKNNKDIINLVSSLFTQENHSIIALTQIAGIPKMVIDVSNVEINRSNEYLKEYITNLKKSYNCKAILITDNGNVFKESLNLLLNNILEDSIWYTELKGNLYMYELPNLNKYKEHSNKNKIGEFENGRKKRRIFESNL